MVFCFGLALLDEMANILCARSRSSRQVNLFCGKVMAMLRIPKRSSRFHRSRLLKILQPLLVNSLELYVVMSLSQHKLIKQERLPSEGQKFSSGGHFLDLGANEAFLFNVFK